MTRAGSAPVSAIAGDMWFNTSTGALQTYDGTDWQPAATQNFVTRSGTEPVTPVVGDMWFNTTNNIYQVYDGADWQDVATVGATAGTNLRDAALNLIGDADVLNSYNVLTSAVTVTVGVSGDYSTINAALAGLTQQFPTYQSTSARATINILSGTQLTEQVIVDGIDLSWITITSVDATVTENIAVLNSISATHSGVYSPFFCAVNGGKFPIIDIKISTSRSSGSVVAFAAFGAGSALQLSASSSVGVNCAASTPSAVYGIVATGGASVVADLATITGCWRNVQCLDCATVTVRGAILDNAYNNPSIYVEGSAFVNARGASIDNSGASFGESSVACISSTVNLTLATIDSPKGHGVQVSGGGMAHCTSCAVTNEAGGSFYAFDISSGSIISANLSTGTKSQTVNTLTANGIIFG